jgi:hypothetical protein
MCEMGWNTFRNLIGEWLETTFLLCSGTVVFLRFQIFKCMVDAWKSCRN